MAKQQTASRRTARSKDTGSTKGKSDSGDKAASYEEELTELLQERIKPNLNRGSIPLLARSLAKDIAARQKQDEPDEDDEARDEPEAEDEPKGEADEQPEGEESGDEPEAEEDSVDDDEEPGAEGDEDSVDEEPEAEAEEDDDEDSVDEDEDEEPEGDETEQAEGEDPVSAFEEEMHQLQEDLGDEWIVRFSVQNDEAWLTAEKEDGSQHVEGPTADVLREAVELLEGGGESEED